MNSMQWRNSKEYKDAMQKEKNRQRKLCVKILLRAVRDGILGGIICAIILALGGLPLLLGITALSFLKGEENGEN